MVHVLVANANQQACWADHHQAHVTCTRSAPRCSRTRAPGPPAARTPRPRLRRCPPPTWAWERALRRQGRRTSAPWPLRRRPSPPAPTCPAPLSACRSSRHALRPAPWRPRRFLRCPAAPPLLGRQRTLGCGRGEGGVGLRLRRTTKRYGLCSRSTFHNIYYWCTAPVAQAWRVGDTELEKL